MQQKALAHLHNSSTAATTATVWMEFAEEKVVIEVSIRWISSRISPSVPPSLRPSVPQSLSPSVPQSLSPSVPPAEMSRSHIAAIWYLVY